MAIFYTIGNINLKTVDLVARSVREKEPNVNIDKVVIFNSPASEKIQNQQVDIYKKYFGNFIREGIEIEADGSIDTSMLMNVFDNKEEKIVDLSNGQKATSSMLFMVASLCKIDKIYYLMLKSAPGENMRCGIDYDYIKMRTIDGVGQLAKISCFDLIYYNDILNSIFTEEEREVPTPVKIIYDGISTGIKSFFSDTNFRSVVNNVTIGNEKIINSFLSFIDKDEECKAFCEEHGIKIMSGRDPVGILTYFVKAYLNDGKNDDILALATLPGLLSALRQYRNISAHYSENKYELDEDKARIVINMSIESIKCANKNKKYWNFLKNW